jgi:hypothetical protein
LNIKRRNLSSHNLLNQYDSCLLFLSFHRRSIHARETSHPRQIDAIIKLTDNIPKLGEQELNEGVGVNVLFISKIIFNKAQSLANPDKVVGSIISCIVEGMQEILHLLLYFIPGGKLIERKQVLLQIQVQITLQISEPDRVLKHQCLILLHVRLAFDLNVIV